MMHDLLLAVMRTEWFAEGPMPRGRLALPTICGASSWLT